MSETRPEPGKPLVVAIDMGYGHLRPATALADPLEAEVLQVDRPPLADDEERRLWDRTRGLYESVSRLSQLPGVGAPLRSLLERTTFIPPLYPLRDLSAPTMGVRGLDRLIRRGLGRGLVETLERTSAPLLTTFFAPALIADSAGIGSHCVVTDADINRMWAPLVSSSGSIRYFVPSARALRRLVSYGVPRERITFTGFPLPGELLGGPELPALKANLLARLERLDPERQFRRAFRSEIDRVLGTATGKRELGAPTVTFAVGGAGAQAQLARRFLPSFRPALDEARIRIRLVAGVRADVKEIFERAIQEAGLEDRRGEGVDICWEATHEDYFRSLSRLLAETDVLWTKPSEMTFYGALGIPLVFSAPVGAHEVYNQVWAIEQGAGLPQGDPRYAAQWMADWLADGTLAAAAWSGFTRLPKLGLYEILRAIPGSPRAARS
jgi:hypothetical protein